MIIRMMLLIAFFSCFLAPRAVLAQVESDQLPDELTAIEVTYAALVGELPPGEHTVVTGERGHHPTDGLSNQPPPDSIAAALELSSSGNLDDAMVCTTRPHCRLRGGFSATLSFAVPQLDDHSATVELIARKAYPEGIVQWVAYTVALTRTVDGWKFERVTSYRES